MSAKSDEKENKIKEKKLHRKTSVWKLLKKLYFPSKTGTFYLKCPKFSKMVN